MVYYREKQIDDAFFALSHPIRRAVLGRLKKGVLSVADISKPFEQSPAQMTKHLAILERGGLIDRKKKGRTHYLKLKAEVLNDIMQWVQQYQKFWDTRLDALDGFLAEQQMKSKEEE